MAKVSHNRPKYGKKCFPYPLGQVVRMDSAAPPWWSGAAPLGRPLLRYSRRHSSLRRIIAKSAGEVGSGV